MKFRIILNTIRKEFVKMITNKSRLCSLSPELDFDFFPEHVSLSELLFFDIETTGLSPKTSQVFLIGAVQYSDKLQAFESIQFLAESTDPGEELQILKAFSQLAREKQFLIHFNGTSFDLPYLRHRYEALQLSHPLDSCHSLDLYRELLSMPAFFRQMSDHKQKTFELLVQYPRKDKLSGKEMIKAYKAYALSRASSTREQLFLHNLDDLKGMLSLLPLGRLKQLLHHSYQILETTEIQEPDITSAIQTQVLFILCLKRPVPVPLSANAGFCYITVLKEKVKIKMPLFEGTLRYFYKDYKNYYYLPFEDEAIHKSVAAYLDASHRQKATAATCYKKISGQFLYAPGTPDLPLLQEEYHSKEHYVSWPFSSSSDIGLKSYLHEVLKTAITQK